MLLMGSEITGNSAHPVTERLNSLHNKHVSLPVPRKHTGKPKTLNPAFEILQCVLLSGPYVLGTVAATLATRTHHQQHLCHFCLAALVWSSRDDHALSVL
jgi:hypothetical protein